MFQISGDHPSAVFQISGNHPSAVFQISGNHPSGALRRDSNLRRPPLHRVSNLWREALPQPPPALAEVPQRWLWPPSECFSRLRRRSFVLCWVLCALLARPAEPSGAISALTAEPSWALSAATGGLCWALSALPAAGYCTLSILSALPMEPSWALSAQQAELSGSLSASRRALLGPRGSHSIAQHSFLCFSRIFQQSFVEFSRFPSGALLGSLGTAGESFRALLPTARVPCKVLLLLTSPQSCPKHCLIAFALCLVFLPATLLYQCQAFLRRLVSESDPACARS